MGWSSKQSVVESQAETSSHPPGAIGGISGTNVPEGKFQQFEAMVGKPRAEELDDEGSSVVGRLALAERSFAQEMANPNLRSPEVISSSNTLSKSQEVAVRERDMVATQGSEQIITQSQVGINTRPPEVIAISVTSAPEGKFQPLDEVVGVPHNETLNDGSGGFGGTLQSKSEDRVWEDVSEGVVVPEITNAGQSHPIARLPQEIGGPRVDSEQHVAQDQAGGTNTRAANLTEFISR